MNRHQARPLLLLPLALSVSVLTGHVECFVSQTVRLGSSPTGIARSPLHSNWQRSSNAELFLPKLTPQARRCGVQGTVMSNQPVINLAIGAIAGCVANAIVFPIDTAKTKMQSGAKCSDSHEKCGVLCQIQRVVKDEGIGGLYKGVVPVLIGSAPETAIQLTVYDIASTTIRNIENIQQSVSTMPMHLQALAGGLAGMSTVIATNPLEVLKIRAQTSTEKKTMMEEIKELGFGGLFHGYQATWFRDVPFAAIYFPVYTSLKVCVGPLCLGSLGSAMIAGMMSGFMASLVTTPADVIMTTFHTGGSKTTVKKLPLDPELVATEPADIGEILPAERLLALRAAQAAKAAQVEVAKAKAKTPICIGKDLVQEQGWGGLFNGVQGRLGRMAPAMAISLTVYETLQNLVGSPAPLQTGPVVLAKVEDFTASPASDGLSKVMAMASESSGSAEIPSEVANTLSKVDLQMLQEAMQQACDAGVGSGHEHAITETVVHGAHTVAAAASIITSCL